MPSIEKPGRGKNLSVAKEVLDFSKELADLLKSEGVAGLAEKLERGEMRFVVEVLGRDPLFVSLQDGEKSFIIAEDFKDQNIKSIAFDLMGFLHVDPSEALKIAKPLQKSIVKLLFEGEELSPEKLWLRLAKSAFDMSVAEKFDFLKYNLMRGVSSRS